MKLRISALVVIVIAASIAWTFVKRPLPVPKALGPTLPPSAPVEGVSFAVIRSAELSSKMGFSVRGGSLSKSFMTAVVAFVVEHPHGRLLIDAGVGRDVQEHLKTTPWLLRALADLTVRQPTIDALEARGLGPDDLHGVVLTHSHWDHVSGLEELREVPVWMTPEELTEGCFRARTTFHSHGNILRRLRDGRANRASLHNTLTHLVTNLVSRREIYRKQGRALG